MLARFLPKLRKNPSEGSASCVGGEETCRGGQNLWVTRHTVDKWMKLYQTQGRVGLNAKPKGRPGAVPEGMASCADGTCDRRPLPGSVEVAVLPLDTEAVQGYVEKRFGYDALFGPSDDGWRSGVFTPQKPRRRAFEQNPEAVEQWVKKIYPLLHARAKREHALMYWGDEMDCALTIRRDERLVVVDKLLSLRGLVNAFAAI